MSNSTVESNHTNTNAGMPWVIALLAVLAVGFVAGNIYLHRSNLSLQDELAQRQQFINESIRLSRLNTQLVQALATMAAQSDDQAIRGLLANHGITFTVNLNETSEGSGADE
jgi:uncharacterized protein HemX